MMLNNTAVQKPSTTNPPTILAQKIMSKAFMTNKNKPNVKMVTGNVKRISKGCRKALRKDKKF